MSTVTVNITLKKQSVPSSPVASGNIRYQLVNAGGTVVATQTVGISYLQATFSGVADGTYTVVAQRMAMDNTPIGDSLTSDPFTVVNMTEVDVPGTVAVTLS
jgi:hypothetical protein